LHYYRNAEKNRYRSLTLLAIVCIFERDQGGAMKLQVVIHEAEEGGYWAEVPAIPGCATQGETIEELLQNLYEAVEGCLSVPLKKIKKARKDRILEIAV
jgi:predicted RNase H-like HicB family nuclease